MIDLWQEIYGTIKRNKLRTFLTGFAVAWGIFMLIVLLGAGNGIIHAFEQNASERALNSIRLGGGWTTQSYEGLKEGHGFFVLHGKFEDMYNDAAEKVDEIAERILMLGGTPENKFSEYLKVAKVKEISGITCGGEAVEHILETYSYLIGEERKVIELANEAGDDATADLMTGYLKEQEKMVWMLVAFSTKSCTK